MPTKIEWCDETFNPWWGCERVSPGCAHCYAATFSRRLGMDHLWPRRLSVSNGQEHGFRFFGDEHWAEPLKWARTLPAKLGRRPRVFCASMADVFEDRPELVGPRGRLLDLIDATPELDWLVLTKRPEFARLLLRFIYVTGGEWRLPPNLWLGVSIETARQTYRADVLREIPAAVRFISAEPLLGSLYDGRRDASESRSDRHVHRRGDSGDGATGRDSSAQGWRAPLDLSGIDWLIIGGESGPGARQLRLEWVRELLNACGWYSGRRVIEPTPEPLPAPFVKQLGSKPFCPLEGTRFLRDVKGGDMDEWPHDLRIREWPSISSQLVRRAS